jgi:hypothetical protein
VEGHLVGEHTGALGEYPATGNQLRMPYVAIYEFDDDGLLRSERVVCSAAQLLVPGLEAPPADG